MRAWNDLSDDEKPEGKLFANVGKMLRRLRTQVILGTEGAVTFEERGKEFRVRRDAKEALLLAEEKAVEEKAARKNVVEDESAGEEEENLDSEKALEDRRESCVSTVEPTPFDSIADTPAEDYSSCNSSVGEEDEEKGMFMVAPVHSFPSTASLLGVRFRSSLITCQL